MKINKLLNKILVFKSRSSAEIMITVAMVIAMIVVFTNISDSISKAITAKKASGMSYDTCFDNLNENEARQIYEAMSQVDRLQYRYIRTEGREFVLSENDNFALSLIGFEGDVLDIYEYKLVEGRLPQEDDEIIVSDQFASQLSGILNIGSKLKITENSFGELGETSEFKVVGLFKGAPADGMSLEAFCTIGGIKKIYENEELLFFDAVYSDSKNSNEFFEALDEESIYAAQTGVDLYGRVRTNDDKMNLYEEVASSKGIALVFEILAMLIAVSSLFMIYNIVTSTFFEKVKMFGLLRSLGLSQKRITIHYFKGMYMIALAGSVIGVFLGLFLNNTVGHYLIKWMIKGFDSEIIEGLIFKNSPVAYLEAIFVTFAVLTLACVVIWLRVRKISIAESFDYTNNVVTIKGRNAKSYKNKYKFLGNRNIQRNKKICGCLLVNFFFVTLILVFAVVTFANLNINELQTMKKALFCDYQFILDSYMTESIDEAQMTTIKDSFKEENVSGGYEDIFSFSVLNDEELTQLIQDILKRENLDDPSELSEEHIDEINSKNDVVIYAADDSILEELAKDNGLKYDKSKPCVWMENSDRNEVTIYKNNKEVEIPVDGSITNNYLKTYQYISECQLLMNWQAYEKYIEGERKYTTIFVNSSDSPALIQEKIELLNEQMNLNMLYLSSHDESKSVINEAINYVFIATYLVTCLFVMSIISTCCIMRVSVKQRKREYSIYFALGMTRKEVINVLAYEARKICAWAIALATPFGLMGAGYILLASDSKMKISNTLLGMIMVFVVIYGSTYVITKIVGKKLIMNNIVVGMNND